MVKISNFSIVLITVALITTLVITATTIELNNRHEQRLIYAMETKIKYYAKRCYLENNCTGEVTLQDLYNRNYLEEVIHPVSKEIIDANTRINYSNKQINIIWN